MAWHVKKHGYGTTYEKVESCVKYDWVCHLSFYNYLCDIIILLFFIFFIKVERVLKHQNLMLKEFQKNHGNNSNEQNGSILMESFPPLKKVNNYI